MKTILFNSIFAPVLIAFLTLFTSVGAQNHPAENRIEKPPLFALQVAVGKYADNQTWRGLSGTYTDVGEMKKLLIGERFQIPADHIQTLIDAQATKKQIFDRFENHLIENARRYHEKTRRRDAVILFQFSGHGSQTPDADGDEIDKFDETLVPYDSQDLPDKNYDITDDEIYSLTARLKLYTDNIVYILDSCHSGSGTRDAGDSRRLPARKTTPVALLKNGARGENTKPEKDGAQTDFLPNDVDYIVISAAQANQLAGQKDVFECETCPKKIASYGYLTFYLIEELKNAKPDTSYRELMEKVRRQVAAEKPTQTPQIEGDANRFVFGGISSRAENFIKISEVRNRQITIAAGAMQAITEGAIVAIYDKTQSSFQTSNGKIAEARVLQVEANKAVAEIITQRREVSPTDKAVIAGIDLGATNLRVLFGGEVEEKLSPANKILLQRLRQKLFGGEASDNRPRAIELTNGNWNDAQIRWDVAILKDNFGKVFADRNRASPMKTADGTAIFPDAEQPVFYLAGKDFVPLYGFYVAETDENAAEKIEKALVHLARLRSVRTIANRRSVLAEKITIKPFRLINPQCENGIIVADKREPLELNRAKSVYELANGERFQLEIKNNSASDLYFNILNLATDGSVKLLLPRPVYEEKDGVKLASGEKLMIPGEKCRDGVLRAGFPIGAEMFKIIATTAKTTRADFEFLEMDSITKRAEKTTSLTEVGDWTTAEINFEISANPGRQ